MSVLVIVFVVVVYFIFGFLWYMLFFGKVWVKEMGFFCDMEILKGFMIKVLFLNLFGNFFLVFVLLYNIVVWDLKIWGLEGEFVLFVVVVIFSVVFIWIGFFIL